MYVRSYADMIVCMYIYIYIYIYMCITAIKVFQYITYCPTNLWQPVCVLV